MICEHGLELPDSLPYQPGRCRLCFNQIFLTLEQREGQVAQRRYAANVRSMTIHLERADCYELGDVRKDSPRCGAKIRDCAIHGQCTTQHKRSGIRCCVGCGDYRGPAPDIADSSHATRHLIYHIYPVMGNGAWEWNVDNLCQRLWLFNGEKIVSIVTDSHRKRQPRGPDRARHKGMTASVDQVKARFGAFADEIDFIVTENDPNLREVLTFTPMMERLPKTGVTLYAQAKGTTRRPDHIAHRWTQALYEIYFDWASVTKQLKDFPITGAFKKYGPGWSPDQTQSDWHYSGSWFWFRNADLFARDWRKIDQFWSGIESLPSQCFRSDEAGCIFFEGKVPEVNLYSADYWKSVVDPSLAKWKKDSSSRRIQ